MFEKPDFYKLFLCFGERLNQLLLNRDKRKSLVVELRRFDLDLDCFLRGSIKCGEVKKLVKNASKSEMCCV